MRPQSHSHKHSCSLTASICALALAFVGLPHNLPADTFYWGSDTTGATAGGNNDDIPFSSWQDATHWFEDEGGTTVADAFPGAADDVIFSISALNNTALNPRIYSNVTVNSLTFNNEQTLNLLGGNGNRVLNIGAGGVTKSADAASVVFGTSAASRNIAVRILEDQTWTNNSETNLRIRNNGGASDDALGDVVLTMNAASTGTIENSGAFSDGNGGSLGLVIDSTGTGTVVIQNSLYSGGTLIKQGVLLARGANVGTETVLLGDTAGSGNATLRLENSATVDTGINVQAGNSGTSRIETTRAADTDFTGEITLGKDLEFATRASYNAIVSGDMSGAGGLIKTEYNGGDGGTLILGGENTYAGDTTINAGTLELRNDGALTFYIGANNVSNSIGGSGNALFDGTFNFNFDNAEFAMGNTWDIVDIGSLATVDFGVNFSVAGFDASGDTWSNGAFEFSQSTGQLTYVIPEPGHMALLMGTLGVFCLFRRRRAA